jgi:hypothetical protein
MPDYRQAVAFSPHCKAYHVCGIASHAYIRQYSPIAPLGALLRGYKMTKIQRNEIAKCALARAVMGADAGRAYVARSLSSLIRSAMRKADIAALMHQAESFGVVNHPEFVV